MSSHVHLLASSLNRDLSGALRDFKKFTGKKLIEAIINNAQESRKEWMLRIFKDAGKANSSTNFQFWRQDNQPKECYSPAFTVQKLNYIHNNPVEAGIVDKAEEYVYSSARDHYYQKNCGLFKRSIHLNSWKYGPTFSKLLLSHRLSRAFEESNRVEHSAELGFEFGKFYYY